MRYLTTSLAIFVSLVCFGQNEALSKRDRTINSIVGAWVFDNGYEKGDKSVKIHSYPLFDSITFNSDMTFRYICKDSEHGKLQVSGNWDIDPKGKTIKIMNRMARPAITGTAADFQRKFKLSGTTELSIEEEFEIIPHPNPDQQVKKVGRETVILNYIRTK